MSDISVMYRLSAAGSHCFVSPPAGLPRFSSQPEGVSVRPGGSEVLSCEVSPELAPFTHWEKSDQTVESDGRLVQLPGGALVISNASQADAGVYHCVMEGLGPTKNSEDAQLQVLPGTNRAEKYICS